MPRPARDRSPAALDALTFEVSGQVRLGDPGQSSDVERSQVTPTNEQVDHAPRDGKATGHVGGSQQVAHLLHPCDRMLCVSHSGHEATGNPPREGLQNPPKQNFASTGGVDALYRAQWLADAEELIRQRQEQQAAFRPWAPIVKNLRAARTEPRRTRATLERVAAQIEAEKRQHPFGLDTFIVRDGGGRAFLGHLISDCLKNWHPVRGQVLVQRTLDALDVKFAHVPSLSQATPGRPEDVSLKAITRLLAGAGMSDAQIARRLGEVPRKGVQARRRRLRGNQPRQAPDASVDLLLRGLAAHSKGADSRRPPTLLFALAELGETVNRRLKGEPTDPAEERRLATRVREAVVALRAATRTVRSDRAPRLPGS